MVTNLLIMINILQRDLMTHRVNPFVEKGRKIYCPIGATLHPHLLFLKIAQPEYHAKHLHTIVYAFCICSKI
jgi:hypothetical protein